MKAIPCKIAPVIGYVECPIEEVTHLKLHIPGPQGILYLPVQTRGTRNGTGNWSWNGDTEKPTVRPSVLTKGKDWNDNWKDYVCHSWINDGQAQFLPDSTHEFSGKTVDLLDVFPKKQEGSES